MTDDKDLADIPAWVHSLVTAVREGDIETGQRLFAQDVVGYGTRMSRAVGPRD